MISSGEVAVDGKFVRVGSKSYAVDKITSVDLRSETKPGNQTWALLAILGAGLALWSVVEADPIRFIAAAVLGAAALKAYGRRLDVTTHRLFLMTAAGEAQAFATTDGDEAVNLREAVERAMAGG